jgi:hypothetical protein
MSSGERKGASLNRVGVIAGRRFRCGVVGPLCCFCRSGEELQSRRLVERAWKGRPQKVTALYAKGDRPPEGVPKYHGTRGILWESGRTIVQG